MKSKITLNDRKRTHFKLMVLKEGIEINESNAESFYNKLNSDESERLFIYSNKHKGYKICVFKLNEYIVLTQCIVNEFKTQNCAIFIDYYNINTLNDFINIGRFLQRSSDEYISSNIIDLKKLINDKSIGKA